MLSRKPWAVLGWRGIYALDNVHAENQDNKVWSGIISSVLWLIVMDEILPILNRSGEGGDMWATDAIHHQVRVPNFHLSRLNEQRLVVSFNVKYQAVVLDPKISRD